MAKRKAKGTTKTSAAKPRRARRSPAKRPVAARDSVDAMLAAFAHEVRTPLTGILALSELLSTSDLAERERHWLEALKNAAEHLTALTTLIVDTAKAKAKGLVLRNDAFDARLFAKALADSLSARAAAHGLTCTTDIAPGLPDVAIGDRVRLRAALENLFDNAVKFTDRGEVQFQVSAAPAARNRVRLSFAVTDSGIGMTSADIRRLFRPFAQANAGVASRFGGAGLGLVMVKRIATLMGGSLDVESAPGRGSTFRLTVVVGKGQPVAAGADEHKIGALRPPTVRELNILCVEDNPYGRVILKTILSELGHKVDFVGSGEASVPAVMRGGHDLVLMDVTLPGIDGIEATRRIRALPGALGRVPIVGLSGRSSAEEAAAARAAGMNDYLPKPASPSSLAKIIAGIIEAPR